MIHRLMIFLTEKIPRVQQDVLFKPKWYLKYLCVIKKNLSQKKKHALNKQLTVIFSLMSILSCSNSAEEKHCGTIVEKNSLKQ